MKKFWQKNFSKFKKKKSHFNNNESIFVPLSVINDSVDKYPRILKTKNFNKTKKIKHPSGTTIIRLDKYKSLIEKSKKNEQETMDSKLISYKNPTKKIYFKKKKEKGIWRY